MSVLIDRKTVESISNKAKLLSNGHFVLHASLYQSKDGLIVFRPKYASSKAYAYYAGICSAYGEESSIEHIENRPQIAEYYELGRKHALEHMGIEDPVKTLGQLSVCYLSLASAAIMTIGILLCLLVIFGLISSVFVIFFMGFM